MKNLKELIDLFTFSFLNAKNGNKNLMLESHIIDFAKEYNKKILTTSRDGKLLSQTDIKAIKKESGTKLMSLMRDGIFPTRNHDIAKFDNLESYITYKKETKKIESKKYDELQKTSPSLKYFMELKPKNKSEETYWEMIESLINSVETYYDYKQTVREYYNIDSSRDICDDNGNKIATVEVPVIESSAEIPPSLRSSFIEFKGRVYDTKRGQKREGLMVKQQPYASQISINVTSIIGNQTFDVMERKLYGGYQCGMILRYNHNFPSSHELIDDIIMYHLTSKLEPIAFVATDTKRLPVYMSAKEFWKMNPKTMYSGIDESFYLSKNKNEIDDLECSDEF